MNHRGKNPPTTHNPRRTPPGNIPEPFLFGSTDRRMSEQATLQDYIIILLSIEYTATP